MTQVRRQRRAASPQKDTLTSRKHTFSPSEKALLRRIGLKISKDLHDQGKPVERLAFISGVARSSIREIIAGRSNPRILTLNSIAKGLGYKSLVDFLLTI